jgi:hypothetical protein
MVNIGVLQHFWCENAGVFEDALTEAGHTVHYVKLFEGESVPSIDAFDQFQDRLESSLGAQSELARRLPHSWIPRMNWLVDCPIAGFKCLIDSIVNMSDTSNFT